MSVKKNDLFMGLYLLAAVIFFIISIPSWLLDIMLAINIGIALIILFNTLYAKEVLDTCGIPCEVLLRVSIKSARALQSAETDIYF